MTDIVTQLFSAVDTAAANSIQTIYQSLTAGLQPVLVVAMTVYVAYWGLEMIFGRASLSAGAFVWKILKMALIWSLALGWSDFSTFVAQVFVHGGDGIATAVCTGAGGTNCSSAEASVSSSLSTLLANALAAAKVVASSGSGFSVVGLAILGLVLILLAVVFVSVGITLVLIGKVALFVLLGMAPFFISMALFGFTSSLFTGWMRTCAQYAIVPLIVYGILGFLLTIMNAAITNLADITDLSSGMTLFAPFMILCVVGIGLVPQSLSIAASIAGGHALHPFNSAATLHTRSRNPSAGDAGRGNSRDGRPWAVYSRIQPRRPRWRGAIGITDARSNDPPGRRSRRRDGRQRLTADSQRLPHRNPDFLKGYHDVNSRRKQRQRAACFSRLLRAGREVGAGYLSKNRTVAQRLADRQRVAGPRRHRLHLGVDRAAAAQILRGGDAGCR